jgi:hypothetical protein
MNGEEHDETSAQLSGEGADERRYPFAGSGWTTTKQAAKVLGVSRRSVQGYIRRGILEAREEGEGVTKRFFVSIDSLNTLSERRSREAREGARFAEASAEEAATANLSANAGESLRHVIDRLEARTEEATELRIRLELTAKAESTLREELAEERRRREEAEQWVADLEAKLEARESPVSPGPSESPPDTPAEAQEDTESPQAHEARETGEHLSWWRRMFGG